MNYAIGILTKMKVIIEEKSINTKGMNADRMREILRSHPDLKKIKLNGC